MILNLPISGGGGRRGLSKISVILIIISIVVLLIIVGWIVYNNFKKNVISEDTTDKANNSDLEILEAVLIENESVQIIVQRNSEEGDLVGVYFNISDGKNFTITRVNSTMQKKDNETFTFNLSELNLSTVQSVSIASIYLVETEDGRFIESVGSFTSSTAVSSKDGKKRGGGGGYSTINGVPSNLVLTVISDTKIQLNWADGSTNEDGFSIERSTDGVTYSVISTTISNINYYSDTGLEISTLYYRVRAVKGSLYSSYCDVATISENDWWTDYWMTRTPSGLTATLITGGCRINYTDNIPVDKTFEIWRSDNDGAYVLITTTAVNAVAYNDVSYMEFAVKYKVRAIKNGHYSPFTDEVTVASADSLMSGLVSFWKLTEGSKWGIDEIAYADKSYAIIAATGATPTTSGISFDADYEYANMGAVTGLTAYSFAFDVKRGTQATGSKCMFNTINNYGGLFINEVGTIVFLQNDGVALGSWTTALTDKTEFHHIAVTLSGVGASKSIELFVDHVSKGAQTATLQTIAKIELGAVNSGSGYFFNGTIRDVGLWNRVLTLAEITALDTTGVIFPTRFPASKVMSFSSVQGGSLKQFRFDYNIDNAGALRFDWGDGTTTRLTADGTDKTINSAFVTNNTTYSLSIYGEVENLNMFYLRNGDLASAHTCALTMEEVLKFTALEKLQVNNAKLTGSISILPATLKYFQLYHLDKDNDSPGQGTDVITGNIDNLPAGLLTLQLEFSGLTVTGNLDNLPVTLTALAIDTGGTFIGDVGNLPNGITFLYLINGYDGITGSINTLPPNLETCVITTTGALTGSINNLPATMRLISLVNVGTLLTGNFETLHTNCTYIQFYFCGTGITYGGGAVPAWALATTIKVQTQMSSATVDALLIALAANVTGTSPATYTFSNARTSASDTAVATLAGKNKTVVTAN